jgi:hypothetical protein
VVRKHFKLVGENHERGAVQVHHCSAVVPSRTLTA